MSDRPGLLRAGFRRVWHYQRVLWFIFFISLVLGHFGASPAVHKVDRLNHSLRAQRLSDMFDVGAFSSFSSGPEVKLFEVAGTSVSVSLVFFVGMLFLTGGILEAYRSGRKLTTREFFEACGAYFWRWVRLLILMLIVLIPVMILLYIVWDHSTLMGVAAQEKTGFWLLVIGLGFVGLLLTCIRLWFDMAQVRAVVEEETAMWRNAGHALRLLSGDFASLFWMYFRISLLGWLVFAVGLYVWAKMPPARFFWTWVMLEFVILFGFGVRLWQRACEMIWYQRRYLAQVSAPVQVPLAPPPSPLVTIAPPPSGGTIS
jgi:hypothetical protein